MGYGVNHSKEGYKFILPHPARSNIGHEMHLLVMHERDLVLLLWEDHHGLHTPLAIGQGQLPGDAVLVSNPGKLWTKRVSG